MKKLVILILVILTTNLNGQKIKRNSNKSIKQTSTRIASKCDLINLKDTINYENFEVIYNFNGGDQKYSSLDSTFSQRYTDSTRTAKFRLTKEEKALIYKIVKEIDFYNLPNELEMMNDMVILPSFSTEITIIVEKKIHVVYDSSGLILDEAIRKRFLKIDGAIRKIIFDNKEVKKLPKFDRVYL